MSQSSALPETPLAPIAAALDRGHAQIPQDRYDPNNKGGSNSDSPKEMAERDVAVSFDFDFLGQNFTMLAYIDHDRTYTDSKKVCVYAYEGGTPIIDSEERVRDTDYLESKRIKERDLTDDKPAEDTQHLLATCIGYIVRKLLDGRNYRWSHRGHDEPTIE